MTNNGKAVSGGNVNMTSLLTLDRTELQAGLIVAQRRVCIHHFAFTMERATGASAGLGNRFWVWLTVATLVRVAELATAAASGSAHTTQVVLESQNVSASLGYQCSSQTGLNSLIQQGSLGRSIPGLKVSLPVNLSNPLAVNQIAQVHVPVSIGLSHALQAIQTPAGTLHTHS